MESTRTILTFSLVGENWLIHSKSGDGVCVVGDILHTLAFYPIHMSLQSLCATKTHVKNPTKISVPRCENEKKVITGRCCLPQMNMVKFISGGFSTL